MGRTRKASRKAGVALTSLIIVAGTAGCNYVGANEKVGDLGEGKFKYTCVEAGDAACSGSLTADAFPKRIAVGGLFDVSYQPWNAPNPGTGTVSPVSESFIEPTGSGFRAKKPGFAALLARDTSNSHVLDFIHLELTPVADVDVSGATGTPVSLVLAPGETQHLRAKALDDQSQALSGGLSYGWQSSDPSVLELGLTGKTALMDVVGVAAGNATLHVSVAEHAVDLQFTVK